MRFPRHDLHTLTGVYALDAVDGAERDLFEHHLRRCRPCGNEVRGLAETATELAMAAALPPPPRVKEHVLAAAAVTRQLPPAVDQPGRTLRWTPRQVFRQSWTPRLAAAVAVVSLAVAVALGAVGLHTRHELDSARAQNQALAAVLAAPDARIMTEAVTNGGTATVVVSRAEGKLVFTTAGLPRLPASKVYELWLIPIDSPNPIPAGTFHPDPRGFATVVLPDLPKGVYAKMFAVTVEDDGPGLAPELRAAVLQRGARIDENAPGSGLGLTLARQIARAHGGDVSLANLAAGGLRARVSLPLAL